MASFSETVWLTSFFYIYNSVGSINSKCSCACSVSIRKVIGPKPDLPDCLLWPCNVCHYNWKRKAWVSISTMWLQVVMSVSRCSLLHNVWLAVVWLNFVVTRMLPNDGQQIIEGIINSDKALCNIDPFIFYWTCLLDKLKRHKFFSGSPAWLCIRPFVVLIRNTRTFLIISLKFGSTKWISVLFIC